MRIAVTTTMFSNRYITVAAVKENAAAIKGKIVLVTPAVFEGGGELLFGELFDAIYRPLSEAAEALAARYSEAELKLIYSYTLVSIEMVKRQTERIRALEVVPVPGKK